MKTLEDIAKEKEKLEKDISKVQLRILKNCCKEEEKRYGFIEDNDPPTAVYRVENRVTGDPAGIRCTQEAPHWDPGLSDFAEFLINKIEKGLFTLPFTQQKPISAEIYVPDDSGILKADFYISDQGINCKYNNYEIVDPFYISQVVENIDQLPNVLASVDNFGTFDQK